MRISLFDGSHLLFRNIFSQQDNDIFGLKYLVYLFTNSIIKELKNYNSFPIVAFDKGGSKYRKELYPLYKGGATQEEELESHTYKIIAGKYKDQVFYNNWDIPCEDVILIWKTLPENIKNETSGYVSLRIFVEARNFLLENLPTIGIPVLCKPGYEADDWGYLFSTYCNAEGLLLTEDSDWGYFVNKNWNMRKTIRDILITEDDMMKKYKNVLEGTSYSHKDVIRHLQSIIGTHNNVPGIRGIGEVRGLNIVREILLGGDFINENNDYYLVKNDEKISVSKTIGKVADYKDQIELNYKIVGYDHIDIDKEELLAELQSSLDKIKDLTQMNYLLYAAKIDSTSLASSVGVIQSSYKYIGKDTLLSSFN